MKELRLEARHDRAIREQGQSTFPHECCGLMLGHADGEVRRVVALMPADNERPDEEQRNRFTIPPQMFLKAERQARKEGMDLLGFYHSHPNAPARPSAYDLEHAWPWYSYVIVSVRDGRAEEMTSWILEDDRSEFTEETIVVTDTKETA